MFTLFPAAMSVSVGGTPTWRLHTGLFKYVHNILKNIWRSGKCTDLKLGEVSQSSISYDFIISWVNSLNSFRIILLIAWQCNPRISNCVSKFINLWNLPLSSLIWGSILPFSGKLYLSGWDRQLISVTNSNYQITFMIFAIKDWFFSYLVSIFMIIYMLWYRIISIY